MKKFINFLLCIAIGAGLAALFYNVYNSEAIRAYLTEHAESSLPSDFEDEKPFSDYYYKKLNDKQKRAYICIFNEVRNHPEKIQIPSISFDDMKKVFQYLKYDNPDIICLSDKCYLITESFRTYFSADYRFDRDVCAKHTEEMISASKRLADEASKMSDSVYDRELYIHDYIVNRCVYGSSELDSTAYGCLIDSRAVCTGYAYSAMLALNFAGIETVVISGKATSDNKTELHLWNMVKLDGEEYFLDVTWDDPDFDKSVSPSHLYFNVTESFISETHSDFDALSVHCTGTKYNYFVYNSLLFDKYDYTVTDKIINRCISEVNEGVYSVEFMFTNDCFNNAVTALFGTGSDDADADIRKVIYYVSASCENKITSNKISYTVDDATDSIRIIFE